MNRRFFGTDGIRDEAGKGLLAADAVAAYGQAVGVWLASKKHEARVLVGRDTRASGPQILEHLASGLVGSGHVLVDGGVLPTPAVQGLCRSEGFDLAIVISASHNPAQDNGIKLFGGDGRKLSGKVEALLEAHIESALQQSLDPVAGKPGKRVADEGASVRYMDDLCDRFKDLDLSNETIVVDCAHGASAHIAPAVLERLGARVLTRGIDPDGLNINRDCGVFHVAELGEQVREHKALLGFALDGDADRSLLVDELGEVRDGDHVLGMLAAHMKSEGKLLANTLVTTVMANLGLKVFLEDQGIHCEMTPVGDRYVAEGMDRLGAVLGGEQSGHVIFREEEKWFGDGLYTVLRVVEASRQVGKPLSELTRGIEKYPQKLINVKVSAKPPIEEVQEIVDAGAAAEKKMGREGRVLLRYSGTESLLRVMVEGKDEALVTELAESLAAVVEQALGAD